MASNNTTGLPVTPAEQAILTTIIYSTIFSFPLTKDELWHLLLSEEKITKQEFEKGLQALQKQLVFREGYYCLSGHEASITRRKKNLTEVTKKLQRARWVAEKLSVIPSILFIGISGGLAVGDAGEKDDIDMVFITKKNTLFISRFLILSLLESLGVRRRRGQHNASDTICANLLFDESALSWFGEMQDVYTAREIAQMVPVFERENIYHQFISANQWVKTFLPNVAFINPSISKESASGLEKLTLVVCMNSLFEFLARSLQMRQIKKHQTREVVKKNILAFHPNDYRFKILKQLRLRMRQLGLLTKF